jgi:hypothetical protein
MTFCSVIKNSKQNVPLTFRLNSYEPTLVGVWVLKDKKVFLWVANNLLPESKIEV